VSQDFIRSLLTENTSSRPPYWFCYFTSEMPTGRCASGGFPMSDEYIKLQNLSW